MVVDLMWPITHLVSTLGLWNGVDGGETYNRASSPERNPYCLRGLEALSCHLRMGWLVSPLCGASISAAGGSFDLVPNPVLSTSHCSVRVNVVSCDQHEARSPLL